MRSTLVLATLAGVLTLTAAPRAQAQNAAPVGPSEADRAEARRNFQAGVASYGRRDFESALNSFQTAYRLAPHPAVRVNMANCYVELRRPAEAIHHFEQFLAESPNASAAQRAAIERQLRTLLSQVAEVRISVTPGDVLGLAVTVDGQTVSTARPARVSAGHHVIEAFAEGYATTRREVDTTAGSPMELSLALSRVAPTPAPAVTAAVAPTPVAPAPVVAPTPAVTAAVAPTPVAPVPAAPSASPSNTVAQPAIALTPPSDRPSRRGRLSPAPFFAVAGVTVASGIVWAVTGAMALGARSDYDEAQMRLLGGGNLSANLAAREDARNTMSRLALISDVAMGVTILGAAASLFLVFRTDFRPATVDVAAAPLPGGGAFSLSHRF